MKGRIELRQLAKSLLLEGFFFRRPSRESLGSESPRENLVGLTTLIVAGGKLK